MKTVRWVYVVIMLALFPVTAPAQTSLYGLPSGKFGAGFEMSINPDSDYQLLAGNIGVGFNHGRSKISLRGGAPSKDLGASIYYFGTEGINLYPVGSEGYEIFTIAAFNTTISEGAGVLPMVIHGGVGLSKPIRFGEGELKPFAGAFYERLQILEVGTTRSDGYDVAAGLAVQVGLEYKVSRFSIIGTAVYPFYTATISPDVVIVDQPELIFRLGINILHSSQALVKKILPDKPRPLTRTDPVTGGRGGSIEPIVPSDEMTQTEETDPVNQGRGRRISTPIPPDETPPPVTVNFVSADPPNGSTIKPDATITVTFDDFPGNVDVTQGAVGIADRTATISGPFPIGPLNLTITWADGVQRLIYTVEPPTPVEPPRPVRLPPPPKGMVSIPAGELQMGSDDPEADNDEKPVHTVFIDAFYMDRYEVTNVQYQKFVLANPRWGKDRIDARFHDGNYLKDWIGNDYPSGKANHPVVSVSWYAAMAYAQWAGKRLPTEAEWEYAARSSWVGQKYLWHDGIDSSKANYNKNVGDTTPVGKYLPSSYGLYDMAGNVWEWCLDEYNPEFYSISPRDNPLSGPDWIISDFTSVQTDRVLRGGSWGVDSGFLRIAYRFSLNPASTYFDCGFRCVMSQ